jgi:hypothetical protein
MFAIDNLPFPFLQKATEIAKTNFKWQMKRQWTKRFNPPNRRESNLCVKEVCVNLRGIRLAVFRVRSAPANFSFRLAGKRHDWQQWPLPR